MDFFNIESIAQSLNVSTMAASSIKTNFITNGTNPPSIIPPEVFVVTTFAMAALTISKSYYDTLISAAEQAPKIVILAYSLSAWLLAIALGYFGFVLGNIVNVNQGLDVYLHVANYQIQLIRWSLILGSIFMTLGPFLLLPPIRKIVIVKERHRVAYYAVKLAQSKYTRYFALILFVIITLFQVFVAYSLALVLIYLPLFQVNVIQGVSIGLCYMFVSLFYLYAFWYTMVRREKKEDLKAAGAEENVSLLKKLRSSLIFTYPSDKCAHWSMKECDSCQKWNMMESKIYLYTYLALFCLVNLGTAGEQAFFWYWDLKVCSLRPESSAFALLIVFGIVAILTHFCGSVFIFNEAFRVVEETKYKDVIQELPSTAEGTTKADVMDSSQLDIKAKKIEKTSQFLEDQEESKKMEEGDEKVKISISAGKDADGRSETSSTNMEDDEIEEFEIPSVSIVKKQAEMSKQSSDRSLKTKDSRFSPSARSAATSPPHMESAGSGPPTASVASRVIMGPSPSAIPAPPTGLVSQFHQSLSPPSKSTPPPPRAPPPSMSAQPPPPPPSASSSSMSAQPPPPPPSASKAPAQLQLDDVLLDDFMAAPQAAETPEADEDDNVSNMTNPLSISKIKKRKEHKPSENDQIKDNKYGTLGPRDFNASKSLLDETDLKLLVQWLEKTPRINFQENFMPPVTKNNGALFYVTFQSLLIQHGNALFAHFLCFLLARLKRPLTPEEEMIMVSIPDSFNPEIASVYANPIYQMRFWEIMKEIYPSIDCKWRNNFETIDDSILILYCLKQLSQV